ncbi:MAG: iron-sulfur cluster repair di-iron protein [Cyclobacteriaceae bacterium]|nr:iron-sulfur cluster repair di-iron protein [Cyclobacteriaceae bacterium]
MNTDLLRTSTVSEIVNQLPGAIPVFEKLHIDYCCNGKLPFSEACQRANTTEEEVLEALKQAPPVTASTIRPHDWSIDLLANYIVQNHHQYVKRTLPDLVALADKVFAKHGVNHPELTEVRELVHTLNKDLQAHMYHEEHVLFPAINALVKECASILREPGPFARTMHNLNPVVVTLENEHDLAGHCLHRLREVTQDYFLPSDACTAFTNLYKRLQEFETDLHLHIHLENNLLFPKTLTLQARQQEKPFYLN